MLSTRSTATTHRDVTEVVDMEVSSPSPPQHSSTSEKITSTQLTAAAKEFQTLWNNILKANQAKQSSKRPSQSSRGDSSKKSRSESTHGKRVTLKTDGKHVKVSNKILTGMDDVPSSAVEMAVKEKVLDRVIFSTRVDKIRYFV